MQIIALNCYHAYKENKLKNINKSVVIVLENVGMFKYFYFVFCKFSIIKLLIFNGENIELYSLLINLVWFIRKFHFLFCDKNYISEN